MRVTRRINGMAGLVLFVAVASAFCADLAFSADAPFYRSKTLTVLINGDEEISSPGARATITSTRAGLSFVAARPCRRAS